MYVALCNITSRATSALLLLQWHWEVVWSASTLYRGTLQSLFKATKMTQKCAKLGVVLFFTGTLYADIYTVMYLWCYYQNLNDSDYYYNETTNKFWCLHCTRLLLNFGWGEGGGAEWDIPDGCSQLSNSKAKHTRTLLLSHRYSVHVHVGCKYPRMHWVIVITGFGNWSANTDKEVITRACCWYTDATYLKQKAHS